MAIRRDVALRAQEIERGFGMEPTESVSSRITRFSAGSIVIVYALLAAAAGTLGGAAVSHVAIDWTTVLLWIDIAATGLVIGVVVAVHYGQIRSRQVAWSLDRYRCVAGAVIASR